VVGFKEAGADSPLPLLADKDAQGPVTTYICRNYACQAPILTAEEAEKRLTAEGAE
jgi:hypothetical protein